MGYLLNGIETDRSLQDLYENEDLKNIERIEGDDVYKVGTREDYKEFDTDKYASLWGWVGEDTSIQNEVHLYTDLKKTYEELKDIEFTSILECKKNAQITIYLLDTEKVYWVTESGIKIFEPIFFYRSEYEDLGGFAHKEMLEVLIECEDIDDEVLESEEYLKLENDQDKIKYIEAKLPSPLYPRH